MYQNTAAEFRPELQVKVEESMLADQAFIADIVFPVHPVLTRTGFFKRIKRGKGQLLAKSGTNDPTTDPLVRAPGTAYREVTRASEQDSWKCVDRGLEEPMDDVNKQEESRFYDAEVSTAGWLMRNMRISREARVAAKVQDESIWGKYDATVDYAEATVATLDFATDIRAGILRLRKRQEAPNTLILSLNLFDLITRSTKLRQYFFGDAGGNAMIDEQLIAAKFKLKNVLIGESSFSTLKPGKSATDDTDLEWVYNDNYFWLGNVQGGPPEAGGSGRTFVLDELTGGQLFVTETYREEKIRSDRLRVRQDDDTKVVNENSGLLCKVNIS